MCPSGKCVRQADIINDLNGFFAPLTLFWRVGIPGCPQLHDEERRPADGIDQHDDQGHSHRLGHGFCDARRWSG